MKKLIIKYELNDVFDFIQLIHYILFTKKSGEPSFSTLKLIETISRSSLSEDKVSALSLTSIEKTNIKFENYQRIDEFCKK